MGLSLSIILPVYNVEKYVEKCILSLEDQDIPKDDYEIICVNDGSPDNSQQIVERLKQKYSNIILINQENQGVSVARNVGIKGANGKYILFVDPDDALQKNCLKTLLNYATTNLYEVVYFGMTTIEMNGSQKEIKFRNGLEKLMKGPDLYFAVRGRNTIDPDRSWGIIFKTELLIKNNLFYLPDVPYLEDGEFIARVLCLANRGSVYNQSYYLRLNRPGSATRSDLFNKKKSINGFIIAAKNLEKFKETHPFSSEQIGLINGRIIKFVILAVHATLKSIKNFRWVKKELAKNGFNHLDLENVKDLYAKLGRQYNRSINMFYTQSILMNLKKSIQIRMKL